MGKYKVRIVSKLVNIEEVEAASEEEAWDKANELIGEVNTADGILTEQEVDTVEAV